MFHKNKIKFASIDCELTIKNTNSNGKSSNEISHQMMQKQRKKLSNA